MPVPSPAGGAQSSPRHQHCHQTRTRKQTHTHADPPVPPQPQVLVTGLSAILLFLLLLVPRGRRLLIDTADTVLATALCILLLLALISLPLGEPRPPPACRGLGGREGGRADETFAAACRSHSEWIQDSVLSSCLLSPHPRTSPPPFSFPPYQVSCTRQSGASWSPAVQPTTQPTQHSAALSKWRRSTAEAGGEPRRWTGTDGRRIRQPNAAAAAARSNSSSKRSITTKPAASTPPRARAAAQKRTRSGGVFRIGPYQCVLRGTYRVCFTPTAFE
jgi:hypothetical protein